MKKLLVATTSEGKLGEIKDILGPLPVELVMLSEVELPQDFKVVEDGETFTENAQKKARAYGEATGLATLADDSGLCVDALAGQPGVKTARYTAGTDEDRWRKLLNELETVPKDKRTAQFVAVVALYNPKTKKMVAEKGVCRGKIAFSPKGNHGFGYDPVFIVEELGKHFAELTRQEKNQVSHRARAVKKIKLEVERIFDET